MMVETGSCFRGKCLYNRHRKILLILEYNIIDTINPLGEIHVDRQLHFSLPTEPRSPSCHLFHMQLLQVSSKELHYFKGIEQEGV